MRDSRFAKARWIVLTNGRECSAAENLLDYVKHSKDKFTVIGSGTMGGSGSPLDITLPKTRMTLRLSLARPRDLLAVGTVDEYPIEGQGVVPDLFTVRELPEEFELRVRSWLLEGTLAKLRWETVASQEQGMPTIVRTALSLP